MVSDFCKSTLITILLTTILSVNGRPAESNVDNDLGDKNGVQILEFSTLDTDADSELKNAILKKLFYNVSQAGLHVPVQVVYDTPYTLAVDLLQKSPNNTHMADDWSKTSSTVNWTRTGRNSRQHNWTEFQAQTTKGNPKQYFSDNGDNLADELVSIERELFKSINRTKNPFAFFINGPEFLQRINNTRKRVPIIFHFFPPPSNKNDRNDTKIDHKYIIPILDKLKEFNDRYSPTSANAESQTAQSYITPQFLPITAAPPYKKIPSLFYYAGFPPVPYYATNSLLPAYTPPTYAPYPTPHYYPPYDMYRQWPSPYTNYPAPIRESYQAPTAYYATETEYVAANGDVCQRKQIAPEYMRVRRTVDEFQTEESNGTFKQQTENEFEFGKRRYDDNPTVEYIDSDRKKRTANRRKNFRPVNSNLVQRRESTTEARNDDTGNDMRAGSDVGPQISKLIVRRGGVAIAGAGGIATAGSGGTAIVGPGGTAFTTPASSGGVAMVGPGGKVVKVPDITNVLYGRTANVAATGAGHSTFTNKNGEVFTTSDNTGGVALVNPGGEIFSLSDSEVLEPNVKTSETKEIQLPAGARLLTTGPIIYYNPVYPMTQL